MLTQSELGMTGVRSWGCTDSSLLMQRHQVNSAWPVAIAGTAVTSSAFCGALLHS